jgi:hypothetical protein
VSTKFLIDLDKLPLFKAMDVVKAPKKIGSVVDLYYQTREQRLIVDKLAAELKKQESLLKELIIDTVPKSDSSGAVGMLASVQIVPKITFGAKDWDKIWAYIFKYKETDILQKRLSVEAVSSRFDLKKPVPGTERVPYKDLSIHKL